MAAMADTVIYNFNATTQGGVDITGVFTTVNNQITTFSFDFSAGAGLPGDYLGSLLAPFNAAQSSYIMDNTNTNINCNDSCGLVDGGWYYNFVTYSTSGTAGSGNKTTGSELDLDFKPGLPGSLDLNRSAFDQSSPEFSGATTFAYYFTAGGAVQATPEPAAWALSFTGVLLLGGLWYFDRRRAAIQ